MFYSNLPLQMLTSAISAVANNMVAMVTLTAKGTRSVEATTVVAYSSPSAFIRICQTSVKYNYVTLEKTEPKIDFQRPVT